MTKTKALFLFLLLTAVSAVPVQALDDVESLRETGKAFAAVARAVSPSVVFIQVEGKPSATNPFKVDLITGFSSCE